MLAVIGCGYGRESRHFAGRVKTVYGIDVSPVVLEQAEAFVALPNFIPVLAGEYKAVVPDVDYVYSHSVFQHIPHEIARDYIETFKVKLRPGGAMYVQFVEHRCADKPIAKPEPVYSWTRPQIKEMFDAWAIIHTAPYKTSQSHTVYWPKK